MSDQRDRQSALGAALTASRGAFGGVWLFSLCINMLALTVSFYMLQVYDRVLTSRSLDTLWSLTALAIGFLAVSSMLEALRSRVMVRIGARLDRDLGSRAFAAEIERGSDSEAGGRTQTLQDLETLRTYLSGAGLLAIFDAPWTPFFVVLVFAFHPVLGTIALGGGIAIFAIALCGEILGRGPLRRAGQHGMEASAFAAASLRNSEAIAAMGMAPGLRQKWLRLHDSSVAYQSIASDRNAVLTAMAKFVRPLLQVFLLCAGAYLVIHHEISPGVMVASSIVMGRALAPVEAAISSWRGSLAARAAYRRLSRRLGPAEEKAARVTLPKPTGRLSVEGVVVAPPTGGKPVLQNVSFSMKPGQILGIGGPSGAGKSSLARCLVGVWQPVAGHARLDGVDLAKWPSDERGRFIGYLPQDVELLDGTIAENIGRFGEMDSERVIRAAHLANVHEMILRLPQGYETPIGEAGAALSGGQRQRIGLARALYGDPALIVLDEPNASLDGEGEAALLEAIEGLKAADITIVMVTHHPRFLKAADLLLLLRNGRVEHFGPRETVMAKLTRPVAPAQPAAAIARKEA